MLETGNSAAPSGPQSNENLPLCRSRQGGVIESLSEKENSLLEQKKSRLFVRQIEAYDDTLLSRAMEEIFNASAAIQQLTAESRVLLKPNLLAKHVPEHAVTTHPAVVRAVIRALKQRGITRITVADSPGGVYTPAVMKPLYRQSGLQAVCEEEGVALYTACEWGERACEHFDLVPRFSWIQPALEADCIINLPKVKTHVMMAMSCAVKNLFGLVPGLQKAEFHMRFPEKDHFARMLVDLCETAKPALTIADGILAMEGDGPAGGQPRELGLLLASEDPYLVDLAVCRVMNFPPEQVAYLACAIRRNLCAASLDLSLVEGEEALLLPRTDYRMPESYVAINFSGKRTRAIRWLFPWLEKCAAPWPVIARRRCIGCGKCAEICPGHTIHVSGGKASIAPQNCIRCFCCHEMCPVKAIDVKRFFAFH